MAIGSITVGRKKPYTFVTTVTEDGAAYNLTGKTVWFTVKQFLDTDETNAEAVITKIVSSHTDAPAGITAISLTATDTNLNEGTYFYDIHVGTSESDWVWSGNGAFVVETPTRL